MRRFLHTLVLLALVGLTSPTIAADCSKMVDPVTKTICQSADLTAAASELNRVYAATAKGRDEEEREGLRAMQDQWMADRDTLCVRVTEACLKTVYRNQIRFLEGANGTDPLSQGRLRFISYTMSRKPTKEGPDSGFEASFAGFKFALATTRAQGEFNHNVDAAIIEIREAVISDGDESIRSKVEGYSKTIMHAPYQGGKFLSVRLTHKEFTGGAHGLDTTWNLNLDVTAARKFRLRDEFKNSDLRNMMYSCAAQIADEFRKAGMPTDTILAQSHGGMPTDGFKEVFTRPNRWAFSQRGAHITFPTYSLTGMAGGEPECRIPAATLERAAKTELVLQY